ncbi:flagellar basal body-associated FliL family protein [Granulicella arctica]|uniref:flagellar basal body-associated FliL family protein n=1 Tax=Granulicella arctica TaxID=940613 RepID=UPI0021DFC9EE|nr:flagellar basal body-associated FliL family protein [Granulicella arctica]
MASSSAIPENIVLPSAPVAKLPWVPLILAMVVTVLLCVSVLAGGMFYLMRSGKIFTQKANVAEASAGAPTLIPATHGMILEPMVANLADAGGAAYLKVALTLRLADDPAKKTTASKEEKPAKGMSDAEAAVRDTVLTVIGGQTADQLLGAEGKQHLKASLKSALAKNNPELKIVDLYFVDFLVQR